MNPPFSPSRGVGFRRLWMFLGFSVALACAPFLRSHEVLMTHAMHEVAIEVGPTNVDVTLILTLHEVPALVERRRMDADRDARIHADEVRHYLDGLASKFETGCGLEVDGRPLGLILLHNPEVDLLGTASVIPAHIRFRLHYFARTPSGVRAGSRFVVQDRLWPATLAELTAQAGGRGGFKINVEPADAGASEPGDASRGRWVSFRLLRVPDG